LNADRGAKRKRFEVEHFGATILLYVLVGATVAMSYTIWRRRTAGFSIN
jgi:hypothetical protein